MFWSKPKTTTELLLEQQEQLLLKLHHTEMALIDIKCDLNSVEQQLAYITMVAEGTKNSEFAELTNSQIAEGVKDPSAWFSTKRGA